MSLTRGTNSKFPCPICLVPWDLLSDLLQNHPIRTAQSSEALVRQARTLNSEEGENLLKSAGLRDVDVCCKFLQGCFADKLTKQHFDQNVFWKMCFSDPHEALSFDKLHFYSSGLFGDHLVSEIKERLKEIGKREGVAVVDTQ